MSVENQKIARKNQVWHLVQRGMLMQLHFDMETFGLDRDFAQIMSYGDALADIAGNMIDSQELHVKRPDRYLADPHALVVTRTDPEELDDESREPHRIAMGKIAQRFEQGPHAVRALNLKSITASFETVRRIGGDHYKKDCEETVLEYPLKDENGAELHDVRYHPKRNMISYRFDTDPASPYYENVENNFYIDEDGSRWKFVEPRVLVSGFRIKWADVVWLRANLVKAGFHPSNIFFTHSRATITNKQKPKNYAVDGYSAALAAHTFGPQGEDGLKLGERVDNRSGETVVSATLSRVMEANTRYENAQRGVKAGVVMPDGTHYTKPRAHRSPAYDSKASLSLYSYIRELAPDILRSMEMQSDEQALRRLLPGLESDTPPIFAMMRNSYPMTYPLANPVTFLGFDDQLGQMRKAIMMRLDGNLRTYRYNGKALSDMGPEDFARMIREQARKPDALIRPEPLRKWPGVVRLEDALKAGGGGVNWDFEQVDDNFRFLVENPSLCEAIRTGIELINGEIGHRADPANVMLEEQWTHNGFGDLDYYEADAERERRHVQGLKSRGRHGAVPGISETLYNKAVDIFNYHRTMDALLHSLALQPHPIDYSDKPEDLQNFTDMLKRVKAKFVKKDSPYRDLFSASFKPKEMSLRAARNFRWKLMKRLLNDDEKARHAKGSHYGAGYYDNADHHKGRILFANLSRNFRVVDAKDRELTIDYLKRQHARNPQAVLKNIESGKWRIQFYRLSSEPSITATLFQFADMGRLDELSEIWQQRYQALKALYLNGAPNEDPSRMRWPTLPRIDRDLERLEINARTDNKEGLARIYSDYAKGESEIFVHDDESQRILGSYKSYIERIRAENPLTAAFQKAVQFDPATGLPYDWIAKEIDAKKVFVIDVPDTHLRQPLEDIRVSPYALVIPALSDADHKKATTKGTTIVLRGAQSGRLYYPGPVDILQPPPRERGYQDFYDQAQRAYEQDAGVSFPANRQILVLQQPVPIAQTRRDIDPAIQAVKVPSLYFDALAEPRLSYMPQTQPLTGLVLPVDYCPQRLETGTPIRFREMAAPMGAKLAGNEEADTGHIYESTLQHLTKVRVRDLRALIGDEDAKQFGFAGALDLWEKVHQAFLDQESQDPSNEEVYVLRFAPVDKNSWAYFNPAAAPEAAFTYDGEPVPPSAYRVVAPLAPQPAPAV